MAFASERSYSIKKFFQEKFNPVFSYHDFTDNELGEVFILPSFKAAFPSLVSGDYSKWHVIGDAALDLFILKILKTRNFAGDVTEEKKRLVGNDAAQPLNILFDEWKLGQFIFADEPLDTHKKANVVEAILGLLYCKGKLTEAMIEKLFDRFLPKPAAKPPEIALKFPSAAEIACLNPDKIRMLIAYNSEQVTRLANEILKYILDKIVATDIGDIPPWINKLAIIQKLNGADIFAEYLRDNRISREKFGIMFAKPEKLLPFPMYGDSSKTDLSDLEKSPLLYSKLKIYRQFTSDQQKQLAKAWLNKLTFAYSPVDKDTFVQALEKIRHELSECEFLIDDYNKLDPSTKALLLSYKPLGHLTCFAYYYSVRQDQVNKLFDLSPELFQEVAAMLNPDGDIVRRLKEEINRRITPPATDKTRKYYQGFLACLVPKPVPKVALPIASAMGGAGVASAAPAPA
ncbi:MAG: ribonuclease III domain-containing protein [Gammaproteobacteria bacterium]|nr:ribonuclease III domain-containing protein [Gammaproteobacteria bacterium]